MNHYYCSALNAGWSSQKKGVCLSVKRMDCDNRKKSVKLITTYKRSFNLVF